jgi:hypothetical protein
MAGFFDWLCALFGGDGGLYVAGPKDAADCFFGAVPPDFGAKFGHRTPPRTSPTRGLLMMPRATRALRRPLTAAASPTDAAAGRPSAAAAPPTVLAIPKWDGRVSPLFDVAGSLLIVHLSAQGILSCQRRPLLSQNPVYRAMTLVTWRIEKLLCGGISRDLQVALESAGITVIPHLSGCVEGILQAYLHRKLADRRYSMPGCCAGCPCCRTRRCKL